MVRRGAEAGAVAVRLLALRFAARSGRSPDIGSPSPSKASGTVPWHRGRGRAAGYPPRLDIAIGCLAADCRSFTDGRTVWAWLLPVSYTPLWYGTGVSCAWTRLSKSTL